MIFESGASDILNRCFFVSFQEEADGLSEICNTAVFLNQSEVFLNQTLFFYF